MSAANPLPGSRGSLVTEPQFQPLPFREVTSSNSQKNATSPAPAATVSQKQLLETVGPPEIPPEEILFDPKKDFLGEGAFGKVYRGKVRGKDVAVKVPLKQRLTKDELQAFKQEVEIMRRIFHPNVVLFLGACTADNNLMIVTELMETDLEHLLRANKNLTLLEKMKLAKDAALGMNWLHGINNIIHRDLKPANLLVDKNRTVKVTDFGFAQLKLPHEQIRDKRGPKGTALYMSPEVMAQKPFNEKADVYSFGLILHEILTEKELFPEFEEWDEFYDAICVKNVRPPIPKDCLPGLEYLMKRCWDKDPESRPSFKEVIFRLDEIIVDCYIKAEEGSQFIEEGRQFWKMHFLIPAQSLQESVSWREFARVLSDDLKTPIPDFDFIKQLLATTPAEALSNAEPVVTLERFSQILQWFGPFFLPQHAPEIFRDIKTLLSKPWFHGDISKDLAEKRLNSRDSGTFLVRLSTTHAQFPFTISKMGSDRTYLHKRVKHLPNGEGFSVPVRGTGNKTFKSLFELVDCADLGLTQSCPKTVRGSLYEDEGGDF